MSDAPAGYSPFADPAVPEELKQAWRVKGGRARRRTLDPAATPRPSFRSAGAILRFREWVAWAALTDPEADLRGLGVALEAARDASNTARDERGLRAQERIADALARVEHGGQAVVMLERLTAGLSSGPRRPLPGRQLPAGQPA